MINLTQLNYAIANIRLLISTHPVVRQLSLACRLTQLTFGVDLNPFVNVADRGWAVQNALKQQFDSTCTGRVTDWAHLKRSLAAGDWKQKLVKAENHGIVLEDVTIVTLGMWKCENAVPSAEDVFPTPRCAK